MSVNVSNLKVKFANLKYEQLLTEKYFVETCFSKKRDSLTLKEQLQDLRLEIQTNSETEGPTFSYGPVEEECDVPTAD